MTPFIIIFLAGLLTGMAIRPLLSWHKHDWEIIFHDTLHVLDKISVSYTVSPLERESKFALNAKDIWGTYKRCRKCNQCDISFNTANREVSFDFDVVKSQLDKHIEKEKEKADKALIDSLNKRIGLTSPEVPYNPVHEHQSPAQQVHHRGEASN